MRRLIVMGCVVLAGCAHEPFQGQCLDADQAGRVLAEMEKQVDHEAGVATATTELLEDRCTRRKYRRGPYRIVLFKRPAQPPTDVQASMVRVRADLVPPEACLAEAERTLERLALPQFQTLVARVRAKEDWRWLDADIGPSKWLECAPKRGAEYWMKLQNFVHELNRDATVDNCLYVVAERTRRCFSFGAPLPPAKGAKIAPRVGVPEAQELIDWILELYLGPESKTSIVALLEEVNAHSAGTEVRLAALDKEGKGAVYDARGERDLNLLPLFLAQTVAYLAKLKSTAPELYEKSFGVSRENRANVAALFERSEKTFEAWRKATPSARDSMSRAEATLYKLYQKLKASW